MMNDTKHYATINVYIFFILVCKVHYNTLRFNFIKNTFTNQFYMACILMIQIMQCSSKCNPLFLCNWAIDLFPFHHVSSVCTLYGTYHFDDLRLVFIPCCRNTKNVNWRSWLRFTEANRKRRFCWIPHSIQIFCT